MRYVPQMDTHIPPPRATSGIARSIRIYHRDLARIQRMDALYAQFGRAGGLVFDIGAHVGDRIASFRRLGARVVAVEPQPAPLRALWLMFHRDAGVTLVPAAIGAQAGRAQLHCNTRNPTISTVSTDFIAAATGARGWEGQEWDHVIDVQMVTLDRLVAEHGLPDFIKIDVEGFEAQAIAGLTQPVPALSFEFTTIQRAHALDALAQVDRLGAYQFNVALGEEFRFIRPDCVSATEMADYLRDVPAQVNSGDVYARRA